MLDWNFPQRIRVLERNPVTRRTQIINRPYVSGGAAGKLWEPLRASIGTTMGGIATIDDVNFLVEGISDQILLANLSAHLQTLGRTHLDLQNASVLPYAEEVSLKQLLRAIAAHKATKVVLVDTDAQGQKAARLCAKEGAPVVEIAPYTARAVGSIEDVIGSDDYVAIVNAFYSAPTRRYGTRWGTPLTLRPFDRRVAAWRPRPRRSALLPRVDERSRLASITVVLSRRVMAGRSNQPSPGSVALQLERAEGGAGRLSAVAFGAGTVSVAMQMLLQTFQIAAAAGGAAGSDAGGLALFARVGWALSVVAYVPFAVLVAATAVVSLRHGALPIWIGWLSALVAGAHIVMFMGIAADSGPLVPGGALTYALYGLALVWLISVTTAIVVGGKSAVRIDEKRL